MEWFSFFFLHNHSKVLLLSEDRIRDREEWTLWMWIEENGKVNDDQTKKHRKDLCAEELTSVGTDYIDKVMNFLA